MAKVDRIKLILEGSMGNKRLSRVAAAQARDRDIDGLDTSIKKKLGKKRGKELLKGKESKPKGKLPDHTEQVSRLKVILREGLSTGTNAYMTGRKVGDGLRSGGNPDQADRIKKKLIKKDKKRKQSRPTVGVKHDSRRTGSEFDRGRKHGLENK